jgi:hypothetical protein
MSTTAAIVIALLAGILIGAAALYFLQRRRTGRLEGRFGPEYQRTVAEAGDRWEAEAKLGRLEKKVRGLRIRPLNPANRVHFQDAWREIQSRFIDDPRQSLTEADRLIAEVMSGEGYPVADFEQRRWTFPSNIRTWCKTTGPGTRSFCAMKKDGPAPRT